MYKSCLIFFPKALTLKLISKLREQNLSGSGTGARMFKEFTMSDPIRYSNNDPVESWLYDLLLLGATDACKL
jgi:N-acetyltransferase 10